MLEIEGLNAFYGDLHILRDVSLSVRKNEIVTIIGHNGAGKTTLIKAIIGLIKRKSGKVTFLGKRIDMLPTNEIIKLGMAVVPEGRMLFPHMTVKENLEIGAYASGAIDKIKDSFSTVFNLFPILKERQSQLASTLSGGEQQMLAIGRALMCRPKFLILDEPSLGIAPKVTSLILEKIKELRDESLTILLVEQNVRAALEISDVGYVLESGRIVLKDYSKNLLYNSDIKKYYLGG
ncbi:MAG: ABC transporter ATP-binding protein [Candidatus Bathyarchaeia archaeon]